MAADQPPELPSAVGRRPLVHKLWPWLLALVLCGIIGVDVFFILKSSRAPAALGSATASVAHAPAPAPPPPAEPDLREPESTPTPAATASEAKPPETLEQDAVSFDDDGDGAGAPQPTKTPPKHFQTVREAATGSCSTTSVDALSRQIIEQTRCLTPNAFVRLPEVPNLVLAPHVFPYLAAGAREHLVRALRANPKATMTVNSALRTVAQQYLVRVWSANKRCGVQLATLPGESNHELGLALDIADHATWRAALAAEDFRWLGATDLVHFDYTGGNGKTPPKPSDVLAFQKLWNRNHPTDKLSESGRYDTPTEQRLKQAPPDGFAKGPSCPSGKR